MASLLPGRSRIVAEARWLGEAREVVLSDDGRVEGDIQADNIYFGQIAGDTLRLLPIRLFVEQGGARTELWSGVETLGDSEIRLVYELRQQGSTLLVNRVAAPLFGQPSPNHDRDRIDIAGAWTVLALMTVIALSSRVGRR